MPVDAENGELRNRGHGQFRNEINLVEDTGDDHILDSLDANGHNATTTGISTPQNLTSKASEPTNSIDQKEWPKVYGRTPSGVTFEVPETHDMVHNLVDPRIRKTVADVVVIVAQCAYIVLFFALPSSWRKSVFVILYLIWRAAYDGGLGWLLSQQSNHSRLTNWANQLGLFDEKCRYPILHKIIKQDLSRKFANDKTYSFDKMPLEYNTWMCYRSLVDLVLMSDFTCYMMLFFCCMHRTPDHSWTIVIGRWIAGWTLILFNLWVKLDAHRVVKDYAWYWGDFFFLEDVSLTFDGVFELAPHPMYSVGYAGYYGMCLISCSYTLFIVSIIGHCAQFIFLIVVENPHIEKTYNPSSAEKRVRRKSSFDDLINSPTIRKSLQESAVSSGTVTPSFSENWDKTSHKAMLIFKEFDITRVSDIMLAVLFVYSTLLYFVPDTAFWRMVTFLSAFSWRLFHNAVLGYILKEQSKSKVWTRLFLKFGKSPMEAYEQWQVIYNMSTVLSYSTFITFTLRQWTKPIGISWPFRYIVSGMLIALQMWTSFSIYESLGEYGWFFGDFFYRKTDHPSLTYSGIYRYLNNPERLFGVAGVWGAALGSNSIAVSILAFVWTIGMMCFIQFVEQPHMQKIYGSQVYREGGITKTLKKQVKLAPPLQQGVRQISGSIDKVVGETKSVVESFIEQAKPKIKANVRDTKILLKEYPARITIFRVGDVDVNTELYSLSIAVETQPQSTLSFSSSAQPNQLMRVPYGSSIHVKWTADPKHSRKDWIGLYRFTDEMMGPVPVTVTKTASMGRWSAVDKEGYENGEHIESIISSDVSEGEVLFSGTHLFWERGVYQFRYHHDGKHNVLAVSPLFEIVCKHQEFGSNVSELANNILPLVQRCFSTDNGDVPASIDESFDDLTDDATAPKRLAYGIREIYGVDLAPSVLVGDGTVMHIAARLIRVRDALRPLLEATVQ